MTYGKSACFHIRVNLNPYTIHYKLSFAFCHFLCHLWYWFFSRSSYLNLRTICGLPSSIPWIFLGHLGGSYKPEAHKSIRYDTESEYHNRASLPFWLMRKSTCFRILQVTTPELKLHLSVLHMSFSLAVYFVRFKLIPHCPQSFAQVRCQKCTSE